MRSIIKIFLPTFFAYLMFAMTNIIDAIFIGNLYGADGQNTMGLIGPIVVLVTAIIFSVVVGTNTYLGHAMGEKDVKKVNKIFNHTIFYGIVFLIIIEVILFIFIIPIVVKQINNTQVITYYYEYISIFLPSLIIMYIAVMLSFVRRLLGDVSVVFKTGLIALCVNIFFNIIFSFVIPLGIKGIAISSLISFIVQVLYLIIIYIRHNNSMFKLNFYKFDFRLMAKIFLNGLSDGIFDLSNAIVQIMNMLLLSIFIGSVAPSYLYVLNSILILQLMIFFSLSDSLNPLISVQYGKKNFEKIKEIRNNALILSAGMGIVIYFIISVLKPELFSLFGITDQANLKYLFKYSSLYFAVVFVFGINQTFIAYLTAIGWSKSSLLLGVVRNVVLIITVTLILTNLFGEIGLWSSYFVSEFISLIMIILFLVIVRPLKKEKIQNLIAR